MTVKFAERMGLLRASEIREILKITQREEVISFAGGLPAPDLFPIDQMKQISIEVLTEAGREALQYSTTEGYKPLREKICERMNRKFQTCVEADNILITSGSQQALDLSGKLFFDEGDIVLCESPTYLAAISAFRAYQVRFIEVPTDDDGMIIADLKKILETTDGIKCIYVIPDFQNPTGKTWPLSRRQEFMKLVTKYQIPVLEDNPYGELRFEDTCPPALKSLDNEGLVIFMSTFSKTFCPGMRIGWIAADKRFIEKYILIKQGADLCTSLRSQMEIYRFMQEYDFDEHIRRLVELYRKRRDVMIEELRTTLPSDVRFTHPQGGLFLWVELPRYMKATTLLKECLESNVAFVPGDSFFPNGGVENTLRLNYSNMPEERIRVGVRRLSSVINRFIR